MDKKSQGKKNREAGQRFELRVRKDLESKGWIVDRWSNNVEFGKHFIEETETKKYFKTKGKIIPAKSRFGMRTTGFPDFIAYSLSKTPKNIKEFGFINQYEFGENNIIGIECKSNGYLTKEEKEKCKWLLDNNIFSKILIAKKGKKRGEIIYEDFMERKRI